ncbi:MAG: DUF3341 domain-containing protein [Firmicutes bacterium]|nr:DUF3341 domain-containing protein [Bacillota bacterium]
MSRAGYKTVEEAGVIGVFRYVDVVVEAIRLARERGWTALRVYQPVPSHTILAEVAPPEKSPVRFFALWGGIAGTVLGFALASFAGIKMHTYQGLLVGGKPPVSVPAYIIIAFELTVLLGGLATLAGFLLFSRLPRGENVAGYAPEFSEDRFGVFIPCEADQAEQVMALLREAGAEQVRFEEVYEED